MTEESKRAEELIKKHGVYKGAEIANSKWKDSDNYNEMKIWFEVEMKLNQIKKIIN